MTAIDRIDQIRADADLGRSLLNGGVSFEQMLAAAGPGGPRLDIESDPLALEAQRIGRDAVLESLGRATPADTAETTAGESTEAVGTTSGEAAEALAPTADAADLDAGDWVDRLPDRGQAWGEEITAAAERHGIEPELLAALVWSESAFDPDAVSSAGAIGLAQLMPGTAEELGVDPTDPLENLDGGARYLSEQLARFGTFELGLAAYNAGPGRVSEAGGVPAIAETQAYVQVVLDRYVRLRGS